MMDDDGNRAGNEDVRRASGDPADEPIGAPVLPAWLGRRRERMRLAVRGLLPTPGARLAATAYVVVSVLHLVLAAPFELVRIPDEWQLGVSSVEVTSIAARVTQSAMMPLLALVVLLATAPYLLPGKPARRPRLVVLVLAAIGLSWLGDLLPGIVGPGFGFAAMIGFFLLAQVLFVVAFRPFAGAAPVRRVPVLLAYGVVGAGIVAACVPMAVQGGPAGWWLVPALVVYCGAIVTMAILAWGVDRLAGIGGIAFVVSDGLIALMTFTYLPMWSPPLAAWSSVLIMSTYMAAQALIVIGVLRHARTNVAGNSVG